MRYEATEADVQQYLRANPRASRSDAARRVEDVLFFLALFGRLPAKPGYPEK